MIVILNGDVIRAFIEQCGFEEEIVIMNVLAIRFESFPYGSAPAFRTLQLLKLIASLGNHITIIAKCFNADDRFIQEWNYKDTKIRCISVENEFHSSYKKAIEQCLTEEQYDLVIRPTSVRHYGVVNRILSQNNMLYLYDSVEWYDASNWRLQYLDYRYYEFQYLWKFQFKKAAGIIAISRLIQNHFLETNDNVVRIPTITDCVNTSYRTEICNSKIKFIFSGQLDGGKDNVDTFIEALSQVDPQGIYTQLDIYGPDVPAVQRHMKNKVHLLQICHNIKIHGKVSQQEAQQACFDSDFSVFFRLDRRSANAGFPTKLGECMTFGTPAICNDTGDISLVLKNGINGYLLKTKSVEEIKKVLEQILLLSMEDRKKMRICARKSAEEFFDYRNYQNAIREVLSAAYERKGIKYGTV